MPCAIAVYACKHTQDTGAGDLPLSALGVNEPLLHGKLPGIHVVTGHPAPRRMRASRCHHCLTCEQEPLTHWPATPTAPRGVEYSRSPQLQRSSTQASITAASAPRLLTVRACSHVCFELKACMCVWQELEEHIREELSLVTSDASTPSEDRLRVRPTTYVVMQQIPLSARTAGLSVGAGHVC